MRAFGDGVGWTGTAVGKTQDVLCNGFPQWPIIGCHLTIASVLLHNCHHANGWNESSKWEEPNPQARVTDSGQLLFCPGLPSRYRLDIEDPAKSKAPEVPAEIHLVTTPRNVYEPG